MEDRLLNLRRTIEDSLDDLSSPRTSSEAKNHALKSLEKLLASAFVPQSSTEDLDYFLALQYTFECNVPSRILSWIVSSTFRLDLLTNQGTVNPEAEPEVATLTSQLTLALSIIQGVCLTHAPTKIYLGRRYALEVLLDLFLSSRHVSSAPFAGGNTPAAGSPVKPAFGTPLPLASVILDTLLCILVDSSPALRVFEACHGVHAVVKILKRAGTPREVRMKCLEFLYFYLLDETTASLPASAPAPSPATPTPTPAPTAPSTPRQPSTPNANRKPFPNATPVRPMSRYGSSAFSLGSGSFIGSAFSGTHSHSSTSSSSSGGSGGGSRSTSGSSTSSFSSTSSIAGSTARSRSPKKSASLPSSSFTSTSSSSNSTSTSSTSSTAINSTSTPTSSTKIAGTPLGKRTPAQTPARPQPRALLMLRKDLDFVPVSPKRAVVVGEDGAPLGRARGVGAGAGAGGGRESTGARTRTGSRLVGDEDVEAETDGTCGETETETETEGEEGAVDDTERTGRGGEGGGEARTTDEKKKLLATMLGNVEALVEGVRKAGIWGLG
ncbi:cell division control protein 14, SIN component-domain-containing protein [Mycena albidolilacea]|uniref:Cell division control protein 14, SIN component-domain-containing protein n=1 Tax=Mycena albidolilacea TaxID=1033008 RepID=A0AAD7AW22_9AGAR|nr:cell division control protein 14, SIN component-domain-containing protein [Mycena albidolilacea]